MHDFPSDQERQQYLAHLRDQMKALFGVEDTSGVELISTIHRLSNLSEAMECQFPDEPDLSGPRWRLMLHLLAEEQLRSGVGLTPTAISHRQRVSKNTISALLRGLEEQGLIQRELDPADYRVFRIRLTQTGRDLIRSTAPQRLAHMNKMVSGLNGEERAQLMWLLEKLQRSLVDKTCNPPYNSKTESNGG